MARKKNVALEQVVSKESGMELEINNFGPVANGKVDLRPLTVFAGPSNTGKSWVAVLIYVLERYMEAIPSGRRFSMIRRPLMSNLVNIIQEFDDDVLRLPENPGRWSKAIINKGWVRLTAKEVETVRKIIKISENIFADEFRRCYGITDLPDFVRQGHRGKAGLYVRSGQIGHNLDLSRRSRKMSLNIDISESVVFNVNQKRPRDLKELTMILSRIDNRRSRRNVRSVRSYEDFEIMHTIMRNLFSREENRTVYYLPADRGGVMHAHAAVVGALIRNASWAGLSREAPLPVLSGVLSDFLEQLIRIAQLGSRRGPGRPSRDDLARNLEDGILRGAVEVRQGETDYPNFVYRPKGWSKSLPLMNASSMVSELTPVALYLRHLVRPGDLLIIEEPEAHLHPAMQARFTDTIVGFVRAGIRVLLTTHSEWVLESLSNIVARKEKRKEELEGDEISLSAKDVGVWLFDFLDKDHPETGSNIREVQWSPDDGGYLSGFDEVARALHNDWADLMSQSS